MIRILFILSFSILFIHFTLAQKVNYDNLSTPIIQMDDDSNKLNLLSQIVSEHQKFDPKKTVEYAKKMLELAYLYNNNDKIIKAQHALAQSYLQLANYQESLLAYNRTINQIHNFDSSAYVNILRGSYFDLGEIYSLRYQPKIALDFYQKALHISTKQGSQWNIAKTEFEIGNTFFEDRNFVRAVVYYKRAEKSYLKAKFPTGVTKSIVGMGNAYLGDEEDHQAVYHYKKALTYSKQSAKDKDVGYAKEHLASFYFHKGFHRECYDWQREALFHYQDAKDTIPYANLLSSFGLTLDKMDSSEVGLKKELEALALFRKVGHRPGIAQSLSRLGEYYHYYLEQEDVVDYLNESIKINEELNDKISLTSSLLNLGKFYYSRQTYKPALLPANRAFKLAKELDIKPKIIETANLLAKAYTKLKDFENALLFERISKETSNELDNERIENLSKQTKESREQVEAEIEKSRFNSIWKYITVVLLLLLGGLVYYVWKLYKTSQNNQALIEKLNQDIEKLKEE